MRNALHLRQQSPESTYLRSATPRSQRLACEQRPAEKSCSSLLSLLTYSPEGRGHPLECREQGVDNSTLCGYHVTQRLPS